jgi:molybdenum cofactor cytidylyltransferase
LTELYALVLAAGTGARFGGRKLISPWRGGVLLDGALSVALECPAETVFLVTGAQGAQVAAAAQAFAAGRGRKERLIVVEAHDYANGLSASLRTGLAALPKTATGVLVFLGDMPLIPLDAPVRLARALADGALAAAPTCQGQRGHPVGFSRAMFAALSGLTGDRGARAVLDGLGEQLVLIETDDTGVLVDVDRPEDLPT